MMPDDEYSKESKDLRGSSQTDLATYAKGDARDTVELLWRALQYSVRQRASELTPGLKIIHEGNYGVDNRNNGRNSEHHPRGESIWGSCPPDASQDTNRYTEWLAKHGERQHPARILPASRRVATEEVNRGSSSTEPMQEQMTLSILIPVYKPEPWYLTKALESLRAQTSPHWEACLCDDYSNDDTVTNLLREAAFKDNRIKISFHTTNKGISATTNDAFRISSGQLIGFMDNDDELAPEAVSRVLELFSRHPDVDIAYTDEDKLDEMGNRCDPYFKPAWSPDLLTSQPYMGHFFVLRRELFHSLGGLRSEFDGSQDYDLSLRATERARYIAHIPEILYHWRVVPGSAAGDAQAKPWAHVASQEALKAAVHRRGERAVVESTGSPGWYHLDRQISDDPLVSIIIPLKDEPAMLRRLLDSLIEDPGYERFELILVDNDSQEVETRALLELVKEWPRVRVMFHGGAFNWSTINNQAAAISNGEIFLFLNNDIMAVSSGWLRTMVAHVQREEVGAVGARLIYPNGNIQHTGVAIAVAGTANHLMRDLPPSASPYFGFTKLTRNFSAVTGACMMVRREVFESIGGFDQSFSIAYNDIDFCLKLRQKHYLIVVDPNVCLVHYESRSRGASGDLAGDARFWQRWETVMEKGDPYYNPNLTRLNPYCTLPENDEELRWEQLINALRTVPQRAEMESK